MKTLFAVVTAAALLMPLAGCYKSDFEAEQKKSTQLQSDLKDAKDALAKANSQAQAVAAKVAQLQSGVKLVTIVDGKRYEDAIALTNEGFFVKNGPRIRGINAVNYTMGSLTDGPIALKREKFPDKPYVTGAVKGNKADGEWMWYDTTGKVTNKQTFVNGKQVSVEAATVDKTGKVTWKKLDKAAADKFFAARKDVFINIPEFFWEV